VKLHKLSEAVLIRHDARCHGCTLYLGPRLFWAGGQWVEAKVDLDTRKDPLLCQNLRKGRAVAVVLIQRLRVQDHPPEATSSATQHISTCLTISTPWSKDVWAGRATLRGTRYVTRMAHG
jgi:hypothetical protein